MKGAHRVVYIYATVAVLLVAGRLVRAVVMAANEAAAAAGARQQMLGVRRVLIPHLLSGRLSAPLPPDEAAAVAVALVAVYCGFSLLGLLPVKVPEELALDETFIALALAPKLYLPMRRLAAAYHEKQLVGATERAMAPLLSDAAEPRPATATFAGLAVDGMALQLDERRIGPISFLIGAAGITAVVGPTGSGKTSVLAAIPGQIAPANGTIRVPGSACVPDANSIAWTAQKPLLLPGTRAHNLALARPDASHDAILETATMSAIYEFELASQYRILSQLHYVSTSHHHSIIFAIVLSRHF